MKTINSATMVDFEGCYAALRYFNVKRLNFSELKTFDTTTRKGRQISEKRSKIAYVKLINYSDSELIFIKLLQRNKFFLSAQDSDIDTRISFDIGRLSTRDNPSVVILSGRYTIASSILNFATKGRAVIAFWRSIIDPRFFTRGIFDNDNIDFIDLENYPNLLEKDVKSLPVGQRVIL